MECVRQAFMQDDVRRGVVAGRNTSLRSTEGGVRRGRMREWDAAQDVLLRPRV